MSRQATHTARTANDLVFDELRDANERLVVTTIRAQEASEAAQQDRARLDALLEALSEGVALVDGAGTVVMLNHSARRIMGLELLPAQLATFATLDFRRLDMTSLSENEHPVARARRGEAFVDTEMLLVRGDGDIRRVITSCTTTIDRDRVALVIIVLRDITARRELEDRLAQTERLAAIGALAAGVAHEIDNPLAVVMTNIDLVLEEMRRAGTTGSESAREAMEAMLGDARAGAQHIRKFVGSLGTLATRADERRSSVDVRAVLALVEVDDAQLVESQLGVGTTSRVVLPPSAPAPVAEPPARVTPSRKATVLVVDDEPAIGVVLRRALTAYDVTLATSVTQALQLIESGVVFDVILSDLMMHERSGIDFYEELHRIDPLWAARIVFVTGGAFTPAAAEFLARVPNERLAKPFGAEPLRELIRKILAAPPRTATSPREP
jgi:PAS domain S-box-containing protein